MALTERSRSVLYQSLSAVVADEQAVQEMLSYFPARDVEEPVTKEFLRAEFAATRAEMAAGFGAMRSEVAAGFGAVRVELHDSMRTLTLWLIGVMVTWTAILVGLVALVSR